MEFVALDFETANKSRNSACSIGLVTVKDGRIVDEYYQLIRPKYLYFDPDNIAVNGITQDMVLDKPSFKDLWPEILPRLQNKQVVAHFAKFDVNVLRSTLEAYYLPLPDFDYLCSWLLAKQAFPFLERFSLDVVAAYVGFKFQHHQALDDARACAAIINSVLAKNPAQDFRQLAAMYKLQCGEVCRSGVTACEPQPENPPEEPIMESLF